MAIRTRKQVLVQLNEELLAEVDELVVKTGRNRSDIAREALRELLRKYSEAEIDRQYIEAYANTPPDIELEAEQDALSSEKMAQLDAEDGGW